MEVDPAFSKSDATRNVRWKVAPPRPPAQLQTCGKRHWTTNRYCSPHVIAMLMNLPRADRVCGQTKRNLPDPWPSINSPIGSNCWGLSSRVLNPDPTQHTHRVLSNLLRTAQLIMPVFCWSQCSLPLANISSVLFDPFRIALAFSAMAPFMSQPRPVPRGKRHSVRPAARRNARNELPRARHIYQEAHASAFIRLLNLEQSLDTLYRDESNQFYCMSFPFVHIRWLRRE